ncbi:hypothetical protein SHELI_v1c07210 [Spiroplasma helicoides]|uniref:Uncharacterized protein n=1 Tax=Spiroplasma helicoides TaxID=216938 RepID=A0A1B3SL76_9MOLU|nr:hypothetical protein [Spiroplasma helicoides]AOG60670.1 hypothetical protein SHELI_v1c07210 [Spiroplasma helicoides]
MKTNLEIFHELSEEIMRSAICLALFENKIDVNLIDENQINLGHLLSKLDPVICLGVTNSIYYHYTNLTKHLTIVLKSDAIKYLRKIEQKSYLDSVRKLESKIIH